MARPNWPLCGIADPGESPRAADLAFTRMADPADRRCDPVSAAQRPSANMYCNHVFKIAINSIMKKINKFCSKCKVNVKYNGLITFAVI